MTEVVQRLLVVLGEPQLLIDATQTEVQVCSEQSKGLMAAVLSS